MPGLLTAEPLVLSNVPMLDDVRTMVRWLERLGASVTAEDGHGRLRA